MKLTRKRLVVVAAALSTVAIASPVSTAGAAAFPAVVPGPIGAAGWGDFPGLPFTGPPTTGPILGEGITIVGPVIITTAPTRFNNTNNQVSAAGNWSGGQLAPLVP
jgi:hypothetical protein